MPTIQVEHLWQESGWLSPGWLIVNKQGIIERVEHEAPGQLNDQILKGAMVPGFVNSHSHAFQYALAGMTETSSGDSSNFWSWRQHMYNLLAKLNPSDLRTIASQLYRELLQCGYTRVVEFHYVHRNPNGQWYDNPLAMSEALIDAAKTSGIQLTLLPVYYNQGSFNQAPEDKQKRFYFADLDEYRQHIEALTKLHHEAPQVIIGSGLHSLRAAVQKDAIDLLEKPPTNGPCHLHIAEQQREVNECQKAWGQRPVEWLLDHVKLAKHHHLVHATHITQDECRRLAKQESTVILCPSTEANLGDGFFPLADFWQQGGRWSIGTDSNISLNPFEELRWLDYGWRLKEEKRFVYDSGDKSLQGELGDLLCKSAWLSAYQAAGAPKPLQPGSPLDACILDTKHPRLVNRPKEKYLSSAVYSCDKDVISHTFVNGQISYERGEPKGRSASIEYARFVRGIFQTL